MKPILLEVFQVSGKDRICMFEIKNGLCTPMREGLPCEQFDDDNEAINTMKNRGYIVRASFIEHKYL